MKTVNKFLLKSYLGPMFLTFFIVMFILLMNFLWRYIDELVGKGLPMSVIIELLFYATSTLMPLGLPLATLLAAIMTMGNLGENNELLALKAAGISLPKILRPLVVVAACMATASFFVANNFVPYSFEKMQEILYDIRQQRQEIEFKDGIFFNGIPDISIRVGKQDPVTRKLTDVLIYDTREPEKARTIVADSGYIDLSKDKNFLRVRLHSGHNYETKRSWSWYDAPELSHHIFDYEEMFFELEGFNFKRSGNSVFGNDSSAKNLRELEGDIDSLQLETQNKLDAMKNALFKHYLMNRDTLEYAVFSNDSVAQARRHPFRIEESDFDRLNIGTQTQILLNATNKLTDLGRYIETQHNDLRATTIALYRSQTSWHEKLSLPVSILIFFLIGAPLGAIIRKGGLGTPIVISVGFFLIYYIITMTGKKLVNDGAWAPFYGMWLSSFILFPLAIFLTYKSATDSQLLNSDWYVMQLKRVKHIFEPIIKYINEKRRIARHGKTRS